MITGLICEVCGAAPTSELRNIVAFVYAAVLLTLMLLVANSDIIQNDAKSWKMTETLAYWYSSWSTQRELSNEYQHDRV